VRILIGENTVPIWLPMLHRFMGVRPGLRGDHGNENIGVALGWRRIKVHGGYIFGAGYNGFLSFLVLDSIFIL